MDKNNATIKERYCQSAKNISLYNKIVNEIERVNNFHPLSKELSDKILNLLKESDLDNVRIMTHICRNREEFEKLYIDSITFDYDNKRVSKVKITPLYGCYNHYPLIIYTNYSKKEKKEKVISQKYGSLLRGINVFTSNITVSNMDEKDGSKYRCIKICVYVNRDNDYKKKEYVKPQEDNQEQIIKYIDELNKELKDNDKEINEAFNEMSTIPRLSHAIKQFLNKFVK